MAELLVQVVDQCHPTPHLDVALPKRGDVIVTQPDGWAWSHLERGNPDWVILKIKGVPCIETTNLVSREISKKPKSIVENRMLQFRGFYLDLDAIVFDINNVNLDAADLEALTRQRAVRDDPTVIG